MNAHKSGAILMLVGCVGALVGRPIPEDKEQKPTPARVVEITILGRTSDAKGLHWPENAANVGMSASVSEPCNLTVHLPSGKVVAFRTDPILFVGCDAGNVVSVTAPPRGGMCPLTECAAEVERLIVRWGLRPDDRMRSGLDEWKRPPSLPVLTIIPAPGSGAPAPSSRPTTDPALAAIQRDFERAIGEAPQIPTTMRVGTDLDDRTQVAFRVNGTDKSGWRLVVEISGKAAEWNRIDRDTMRQRESATRPSP
jgi:hypothetical protein